MTDPITDLLNRLKNGQAVNKKTVDVPYSKIKYQIAKVMEAEGFIESAVGKGRAPKKIIRIGLRYKNGKPVIKQTKRVSKPGRRVYISLKDIKPVKGGYGIAILSTSKGIMSNKEAHNAGIGGELLCEIY